MLGAFLALLAALAVAVQALLIRLGTDEGPSREVLFVVLAANIVVLVPSAILLGYPDYELTRRSIGAFVMAGILGTLIGRALFYESIDLMGASRAETVKASQPLHAAVVAVIVLGEVLTSVRLLGIVLIVVGVAFVTWTTSDESDTSSWPVLLALGGAFFFGVEPVFANIGLGEGTPVVVGLAVKTTAATVSYIAYSYWKGIFTLNAFRSPDKWLYVLAAVANTVFIILYYAALTLADVVVVVPILQTSPLFVIFLSVVFLDEMENVDKRVLSGSVLVVIGAVMVTVAGGIL